MRIARDQVIAGIPALQARETMRKLDRVGSEGYVLDVLRRLDVREPENTLSELVRDGWLQHTDSNRFTRTERGTQLAAALASKPISRKTAERLLAEVIRRANEAPGLKPLLTT